MPVKKTTTLHGTYTMQCNFKGDGIPSQMDWEQTFVCLNHKVIKVADLKFVIKVFPAEHRIIKVFSYVNDPYVAYSQKVYVEFDADAPDAYVSGDLHQHTKQVRDELAKHLIGWNISSLQLEDLS
jgi:hypothetical protein